MKMAELPSLKSFPLINLKSCVYVKEKINDVKQWKSDRK